MSVLGSLWTVSQKKPFLQPVLTELFWEGFNLSWGFSNAIWWDPQGSLSGFHAWTAQKCGKLRVCGVSLDWQGIRAPCFLPKWSRQAGSHGENKWSDILKAHVAFLSSATQTPTTIPGPAPPHHFPKPLPIPKPALDSHIIGCEIGDLSQSELNHWRGRDR